jgi:hypothetical protein
MESPVLFKQGKTGPKPTDAPDLAIATARIEHGFLCYAKSVQHYKAELARLSETLYASAKRPHVYGAYIKHGDDAWRKEHVMTVYVKRRGLPAKL